MRRAFAAQLLSDWLMLIGALGLFVSLFLTWSHQLTHGAALVAASAALRGVPRSPTAWQVYSVADVLLALVVGAVLAVAVLGGQRPVRLVVLVAVAAALAFTAHASSVAPTTGLVVVNPATAPAYLPHAATAGAGETMAIISLALAGAGVGLSLPHP